MKQFVVLCNMTSQSPTWSTQFETILLYWHYNIIYCIALSLILFNYSWKSHLLNPHISAAGKILIQKLFEICFQATWVVVKEIFIFSAFRLNLLQRTCQFHLQIWMYIKVDRIFSDVLCERTATYWPYSPHLFWDNTIFRNRLNYMYQQ